MTKPLASEQTPGTSITLVPGVRRTVLPSGLRIITEAVPGVRSVSIGVYVSVGSRDEAQSLHGASHFLEHLLFKGTPERNAMDISVAMDAVGGEFNAFTAKEFTCYHAKLLDEDLPMAIDILGDMLTSSLITPADVEAEREVILDEIAMHDDDPDDVAHNMFAGAAWAGSPLAKPIAGTADSIRAMNRTQINRYYRGRYRAEAMTVAVAGNVNHAEVVRRTKLAFARNDFLAGEAAPKAPRMSARARSVKPGTVSTKRAFEQANLVLGMGGITRSDRRRHALGVLNAALGGGSSSRLFQEVREVRGLAYSVYSFATSYSDAGLVGVNAGTLPGKVDDVLTVVREQLDLIADKGITDEELARGKGQLRGALVLGLEDTATRMSRLGESELFQAQLLSTDEALERINGVTVEQVGDLAATLYSRPEILAVVAP